MIIHDDVNFCIKLIESYQYIELIRHDFNQTNRNVIEPYRT